MRFSNRIENGRARLVEAGPDGRVLGPAKVEWLEEAALPTEEHDGWGVPVSNTARIICIGLNYSDHAAELGEPDPEYPALFVRFLSSFTGHEQVLSYPAGSSQFDFEGELAVVIGKKARSVSAAHALEYVFGYTIANDGSARDFQFRSQQWISGKIFDKSGGLGPSIVSADAVPPGAVGLKIETRLNGETIQSSNTNQLIFPVADLVSEISQIMTLLPGDLILTGTPAGVGISRTPQIFMQPGDICEVEIEGIGVLRNTVSDRFVEQQLDGGAG